MLGRNCRSFSTSITSISWDRRLTLPKEKIFSFKAPSAFPVIGTDRAGINQTLTVSALRANTNVNYYHAT